MSENRFNSIWDALEDTPQQAASMRTRSELMMGLQKWVKQQQLTQTAAATIFGVTQPRVSDLVRGRISLFSIDALIDMASAAGLSPTISIKLPKTPRKTSNKELLVA